MISKNHVTRLSKYKTVLKQLKKIGMVKVFADNIADASGVTPIQIRKDFSIFGIIGNKKGGYVIAELIDKIESLLGKSERRDVIIIGHGNIGMAIVNYPGFEADNIKIVASFDVDEDKINPDVQPPVLGINDLELFINKNSIDLAILAVPDLVAQDVFDLLCQYGIRGVLNFSSTHLKTEQDIFVNNIDVKMALETVIFYTHSSLQSQQVK
jgi:redox-sensing transcriptional repressor